MLLLTAYDLRGAVVVDIAGTEIGLGIVRSVWCQLLQVIVQFLGDILEIDDGIDVESGLRLFGQDVLVDILLEPPTELWNVLDLQ